MNTVNYAALGTLSGLLCGVKATDNRREFPRILRFCGEKNESGEGRAYLWKPALRPINVLLADNVLVDGMNLALLECNQWEGSGNKSAYLK